MYCMLLRNINIKIDIQSWLLNGLSDLKNLFNFVFRKCFVAYYINCDYNLIKIKEDMAFENVDYAISRKLEVRF